MFNASSSSNNSSAMPLDLGSNKKDLFNSSTSDFFDPPPPPGGPGGGFSPLFDRPLYQLLPYQVINLSFLRKLEVFNSILNAFGDLFSSKIQITEAKDLLDSKSPFPLHSKYDFSKLDAFDVSSIPPIILQCYGASTSKGPDRDIHNAASSGDLTKLRQLLQARGPVAFNEPDPEGMTPAHYAAVYGHVDALRFLATLDSVNLNKLDKKGNTPAHHAAEKGQTVILQFLATLDGINLNQPGNARQTPAHLAAQNGYLGTLKFLATLKNVNLNQLDNAGQTPAHLAEQNGYLSIHQFLTTLKDVNLNQPDDDGLTLAHYAVLRGDIELLKVLLAIDSEGLIHIAAQSGDVPILRQLLRTMRSTAFNKPDSAGITPAHIAAARGDISVFRFFATLEGINLNQADHKGQTLVHYAACQGNIDVLKFLATLDGVNLNRVDNAGQTPAHLAAAKEHILTISFLKIHLESKLGIPLDDNIGEVFVPPPRASAPLRVEVADEDPPPAYAVVDPMAQI